MVYSLLGNIAESGASAAAAAGASALLAPNIKVPNPLPVANPADAQNRMNDALAARLQAGGSNADNVSNASAPVGAPHMGTLTGLN